MTNSSISAWNQISNCNNFTCRSRCSYNKNIIGYSEWPIRITWLYFFKRKCSYKIWITVGSKYFKHIFIVTVEKKLSHEWMTFLRPFLLNSQSPMSFIMTLTFLSSSKVYEIHIYSHRQETTSTRSNEFIQGGESR